MASWAQIGEALERYSRTERWNNEVFCVTISLVSEQGADVGERGRAYQDWNVYVRHEVMPRKDGEPGQEFVAIDAPIGSVGSTDLMSAIGHVGHLTHGLLGYAQGTDNGTLSIGTRVPADLIDAAHPESFLMLLYSIASAARAVIPELGREDGFYASRAEQIRESTWKSVLRLAQNDASITVERDFGKGLVFSINGLKDPRRKLRMLACRNDQGVGEHYVTFEFALGAIHEVDMPRAAQAAATTNGGLVYQDGFVSFRVSQHLTALTYATFATSVLRLVDAAEEYLENRSPAQAL